MGGRAVDDGKEPKAASSSAAKFFADVIAGPDYHNTYLTKDSWLFAPTDAHGPFSIGQITPNFFAPIAPADIDNRILTVLYHPDCDPPTHPMAEKVKSLVHSIPKSVRFHTLTPLHDRVTFEKSGFKQDFEPSFFHSEFSEFVAVDIEHHGAFSMMCGLG